MTEQQIDVEFEHIMLDKEERDAASGIKVYVDSSYDESEAEENRRDAKLFIEEDIEDEGDFIPDDEHIDEGEWEDVEIDDFDAD